MSVVASIIMATRLFFNIMSRITRKKSWKTPHDWSFVREIHRSPLNSPHKRPVIRKAFPWASFQIRKIAGAHAPGMPGTLSPSPQVSDPDMHHGTCITHVPWCMLGSLTSGFLWNRRRGKTFPTFPAHAQPAILRIWQEAHGMTSPWFTEIPVQFTYSCFPTVS